MTKLLTLWLVMATPTPACIEKDLQQNTRLFIDAATQKAERLRITQSKAPAEQVFSVFAAEPPKFDDDNGCYEVYIGSVKVKAQKVEKPSPKQEAKK